MFKIGPEFPDIAYAMQFSIELLLNAWVFKDWVLMILNRFELGCWNLSGWCDSLQGSCWRWLSLPLWGGEMTEPQPKNWWKNTVPGWIPLPISPFSKGSLDIHPGEPHRERTTIAPLQEQVSMKVLVAGRAHKRHMAKSKGSPKNGGELEPFSNFHREMGDVLFYPHAEKETPSKIVGYMISQEVFCMSMSLYFEAGPVCIQKNLFHDVDFGLMQSSNERYGNLWGRDGKSLENLPYFVGFW